MNNLETALQRFYTREREGKVVFHHSGLTLTELALRISERLGFSSFDAAALSRVVNGERLFTAAQLQAFCEVLQLGQKQQDWLTVCLQADYVKRVGLPQGAFFLSVHDGFDLLDQLFASTLLLRYDGDQLQFLQLTIAIQQLLERLAHHSLSVVQEQQIGLFRSRAIFLEARGLVRNAPPERALPTIRAHVRQLHRLSKQYPLPTIPAFLHSALSQAYYAAGGYAQPEYKPFYFRSAIASSKKAIDLMTPTDPERILV